MKVCMSMLDVLLFGMVLWLHCLGPVCKKLALGFDDAAPPARGCCYTPIKRVVLGGAPDTSHLAASSYMCIVCNHWHRKFFYF